MFKVGDKVKVLESGSYGHAIDVGSVAQVIDTLQINGEPEPSVLVYGFWSYADEYLAQSIHPSELELVK